MKSSKYILLILIVLNINTSMALNNSCMGTYSSSLKRNQLRANSHPVINFLDDNKYIIIGELNGKIYGVDVEGLNNNSDNFQIALKPDQLKEFSVDVNDIKKFNSIVKSEQDCMYACLDYVFKSSGKYLTSSEQRRMQRLFDLKYGDIDPEQFNKNYQTILQEMNFDSKFISYDKSAEEYNEILKNNYLILSYNAEEHFVYIYELENGKLKNTKLPGIDPTKRPMTVGHVGVVLDVIAPFADKQRTFFIVMDPYTQSLMVISKSMLLDDTQIAMLTKK